MTYGNYNLLKTRYIFLELNHDLLLQIIINIFHARTCIIMAVICRKFGCPKITKGKCVLNICGSSRYSRVVVNNEY